MAHKYLAPDRTVDALELACPGIKAKLHPSKGPVYSDGTVHLAEGKTWDDLTADEKLFIENMVGGPVAEYEATD